MRPKIVSSLVSKVETSSHSANFQMGLASWCMNIFLELHVPSSRLHRCPVDRMFGKVTFPLKGWKKVTNPTMVKVKRSVKVILITS